MDTRRYSFHNYKILTEEEAHWTYVIHCEQDYLGYTSEIESAEYYDTEAEAVTAAQSHIDRLEDGE